MSRVKTAFSDLIRTDGSEIRKTNYEPVVLDVLMSDCADVIQTSGPLRGAFDADGEDLG